MVYNVAYEVYSKVWGEGALGLVCFFVVGLRSSLYQGLMQQSNW